MGQSPRLCQPTCPKSPPSLERQGRQEEYLNFEAAEAQIPEYLTMLTRLGRFTEVMAAQSQIADLLIGR